MMVYEGSELIGFLFKAFALVVITGMIAIPLVPQRIKPVISIISVSLAAFVTSFLALRIFSGGSIEYIIYGGIFFGDIPLRVDSLSAWFILIINFTSVTGAFYGTGYLKAYSARSAEISFHWILYVLFYASMLLVCMIQHSIAFITAWEIMSLSSLLLVLFDYKNPKVIKAGVNYLVQMHLSVVLLTVGFIWAWFKTGTFDFRGLNDYFGQEVNIWLFLVFFAGFGFKSGFLGLHTWLPEAHPAAPSHVSGVMSGVIVKLGIYGILRIITFLKAEFLLIGVLILCLSLLTGLFGILNASLHRDFKRMLAYCTIENIGIIGIGTGLGLMGIGTGQTILTILGFGGALLHVLNHSLFKSLLFYSAGSVYRQTHTRDMDKLGGLIRHMPKTALLFLVASVAIGGIPPFNGFVSEFLIYSGLLAGITTSGISQMIILIITLAGLAVIGGISVITFTKTFGTVFLGNQRQQTEHPATEVPSIMLIPQYLIVCIMLLIAFFPGFFMKTLFGIIDGMGLIQNGYDSSYLVHTTGIMKGVSLSSVIFILISAAVFLLRKTLVKGSENLQSQTWGCGYVNPSVRMQYTGKSFSKSLGKLLNFVVTEKKSYQELQRNEIFPEKRKYRSFYLDIIDSKIVDPLLYITRRFMNLFQFIQNGRIQAYVIYGIVFIMLIFIGTLLNFMK